MIIGITGQPPAGSGKDTVANYLVKHYSFVKVALADPMKRFCAEVFDFTDEQLWGPSEQRNEPDKRFKRPLSEQNEAVVKGLQVPREFVLTPEMCHLTPRYALQRLGTEWGRDCYSDVWVDYCLRVAKKVMWGQEHKTHDKWDYSQEEGLFPWNLGSMEDIAGVVIPDVRFDNEAAAIQKAGGKIWLINRHDAGLKGEAGKHASELGVSEEFIDFCIKNNKGFGWLYQQVQTLMNGKQLPPSGG